MKPTHFNSEGKAVMVDVSEKEETVRTAVARGGIRMNEAAYLAVKRGTAAKGDVLGVAAVAGITAAKRTWEIIPMCHNIPLSGCEVTFTMDEVRREVGCTCTVKTVGKTGAEMEALNGVSTALLTVYDMCKAVQRDMEIRNIYLAEKDGGRSGHIVNRERE